MEFFDLGAHCGVCKNQDFLPYKCKHCKHDYCFEHQSVKGHECPDYVDDAFFQPQCPLCQEYITATPSNVDEKMNAHISRGCATERQGSTHHPCHTPGCSTRSAGKFTCPGCPGKTFCLQHRLDFDHNCPALARKKKSRQGGLFRGINVSHNMTKDLQAVEPIKQPHNKKKAKGLKRIPEEKRLYLTVHVPFDGNKRRVQVFVSSEWTVGKSVDVISDVVGVLNTNNSSSSERLSLFSTAGRLLGARTLVCDACEMDEHVVLLRVPTEVDHVDVSTIPTLPRCVATKS